MASSGVIGPFFPEDSYKILTMITSVRNVRKTDLVNEWSEIECKA